jgi:hypothetical protein
VFDINESGFRHMRYLSRTLEDTNWNQISRCSSSSESGVGCEKAEVVELMIGNSKPVSNAGDDLGSETVGLGRDLKSSKVSVLWKARWMVVLVEVVEGQMTQRSFDRRVVAGHEAQNELLALEVENSNRYALLTPSSRRQTLGEGRHWSFLYFKR